MKIGDASFYLFLRKSRLNAKGQAPIHCRIQIDGEIRVISTGFFIEPKYWNRTKLTVNHSKNPLAFHAIEVWKKKITLHFTNAYLNNQKPDIHQLMVDLGCKKGNTRPMGIAEVFRIYLEGIQKQVNRNYTDSTYRHFKTIYTHLKQFIKTVYEQNDLPLKELKFRHLVEFEEYLTEEVKLKQITINKTIQKIKTVVRYAISHDYLDKDPWLVHRSKSVSIEIRYLTKAELAKIETYEFHNPKHVRVRDCFVFSCYTGFGYQELKNLNNSNLEEKNKLKWLKIKRQKTQRIQQVPLLPKAEAIWEKYRGKLPMLSNQKMNQYLKEIGSLCGIETIMSTHLARKTFASTVLLANNVPIKVVSTLLSHSDSRVTEKHYAELQQDVLGQELLKLMNK